MYKRRRRRHIVMPVLAGLLTLATLGSTAFAAPSFSLELVILSGVLQWTYQIQLPLLPNAESAPAGHPPRPDA